ncbi:CrcB family protein, partial [bacterium]|nr:CrcB family protein [bacterium]
SNRLLFYSGLGALVRYIMYLIMPHLSYIPLATLIANFFGCFIATIVFVYFASKTGLNPTCKIFLITGFCGGLSTLSALSLELLHFIQAEDYTRAIIYVLSTIFVCATALFLGLFLVKSNLS